MKNSLDICYCYNCLAPLEFNFLGYFKHKKTGNIYRAYRENTEVKQGDGHWIDHITYVGYNGRYSRDSKTFHEKFEKVQ